MGLRNAGKLQGATCAWEGTLSRWGAPAGLGSLPPRAGRSPRLRGRGRARPSSPRTSGRRRWGRRGLRPAPRAPQEPGEHRAGVRARDGGARLGAPAAGRLHSHRAPGQRHVRHGVQGLRQGARGASGCRALARRPRSDRTRAPAALEPPRPPKPQGLLSKAAPGGLGGV